MKINATDHPAGTRFIEKKITRAIDRVPLSDGEIKVVEYVDYIGRKVDEWSPSGKFVRLDNGDWTDKFPEVEELL